MPTKEIDVAIKELERQVEYYENLLDKSISNNEILLKVKFIYHQLKDVSQKLHELKKMKGYEVPPREIN